MKIKGFYPFVFCLLIGGFMGKFMLDQYKIKEEEMMASFTSNTVYFIEQGQYSSKELMEENINNVAYYIYTEKDGIYY